LLQALNLMTIAMSSIGSAVINANVKAAIVLFIRKPNDCIICFHQLLLDASELGTRITFAAASPPLLLLLAALITAKVVHDEEQSAAGRRMRH
jgi:hypothetical protein